MHNDDKGQTSGVCYSRHGVIYVRHVAELEIPVNLNIKARPFVRIGEASDQRFHISMGRKVPMSRTTMPRHGVSVEKVSDIKN